MEAVRINAWLRNRVVVIWQVALCRVKNRDSARALRQRTLGEMRRDSGGERQAANPLTLSADYEKTFPTTWT